MRAFVLSTSILFFLLFSSPAGAVGELVDEKPSWEELMQLVHTNRVRQDTAKAKRDYNNPSAPKNKTWPGKDYSPCPPLLYQHQVAVAARNHSVDMSQKGYFSHDGQDGSTPSVRIRRVFTDFSSAGENIARGQKTPLIVTVSWLNSDGHRENIFKCSWTHIGVGYTSVGYYWTQNFVKVRSAYARPLIHAGVHDPKNPSADSEVTFHANYYASTPDFTPGAPKEAKLVVNGKCYDMRLEYGTAANGNYLAKVKLPKGCHKYYFRFRDAAGKIGLYPTRGSYHFGADSQCAGFYVANQQEANCDAGCKSNDDCASHQDCKDGKCVDSGKCKTDTDCSDGFTCKAGACTPKERLGTACTEPADCTAPLICASIGGKFACTIACTETSPCPQGYTCKPNEKQNTFCAPKEGCTSDTDCPPHQGCNDGKCADRSKCEKHGECPQGTMCSGGICSDPGSQGNACEGANDCDKGEECVPWTVEGEKKSLCSLPCEAQDECPKTTECKEFAAGRKFCLGKPEKPEPPPADGGDGKSGGGCTTAHIPLDAFPFAFFLLALLALRKRTT